MEKDPIAILENKSDCGDHANRCGRTKVSVWTMRFHKGLLLRFVHDHQTKVRFVLVGAWNTFLGYAAFVLLDTLFSSIFTARSVAYMTAMVIAYILSIVNAYVFHKYITFKSEVRGRRVVGEFFRFCTTYLVTFVLNLILLPTLVEICHFQPKLAGALVIPVCTVVSYLGHSRFSFKHVRLREKKNGVENSL